MDEPTYYYICFTVIAFEFDITEKADTEQKIKKKLKYHKLGKYDQSKIDNVRNLKNELLFEISRNTKSRFYKGSKSQYASLNDFDTQTMINELGIRYSCIDKNELTGIINYALYLYHLK